MCGRPFIRFVTFSGYLNKIFKKHEVLLTQLNQGDRQHKLPHKNKGKTAWAVIKNDSKVFQNNRTKFKKT